jgi:squalene-hopene/tetraprenyl-beta-curcumene cyclase
VPLLVVMALKPRARNPRGVGIGELFVIPPAKVGNWHSNVHASRLWGPVFRGVDAVLRRVEPHLPTGARSRAVRKAVAFVTERLNGDDGLGAIYPAIANTVMMFDALGYPRDHPDYAVARQAVRKLLVLDPKRSYCQPCLSPVWDTALSAMALLELDEAAGPALKTAADWLAARQITDVVGDWASRRPGLKPGGWAFQYANPHYPDLDDTAVVVMALHRVDPDRYRDRIWRAADWVLGMQSRNGGWGAFDADNTYGYLNHIPFADHGALLDPPTVDVTARCVGMLRQLGYAADHPAITAGVAFLLKEQEADGSWFGRWGTNHVYGTWSVLCALNAVGHDTESREIRRAVHWLADHQREDGGWGEDGSSYEFNAPTGTGPVSTASQTAWALLGLMAAGAVDHPAVQRGVDFLLRTQDADGLWQEDHYTAVGFPRVFYLRYHGYRCFFPLWALARFRNLRRGNSRRVENGM